MIIFGPVPSRRLGNSLGINTIPPKICSYSCMYCQLGRTHDMQVKRQPFYQPDTIMHAVKQKVTECKQKEVPLDYLTFVPDGEPTLDINLGKEIDLISSLDFGIKIAVITNSSLIDKEGVKTDLCKADWVSVKIDAIHDNIWRKIDRPHGSLNYDKIKQGLVDFSNRFTGELVTETMLVHDVNVEPNKLAQVADFIAELHPAKSYLSIPIRPPAEQKIQAAFASELITAYQIFKDRDIDAEYLIGYEGNAFASTGNVEEDLLSITSVHPMREDAVEEMLQKANVSWDCVQQLIAQDKLLQVEYNHKKFYMRKLQ